MLFSISYQAIDCQHLQNFVLGKGLHSYGFGIGGETYVATFIVLDLLFVAFAAWRYRKSKSTVALASGIEGERVAV